MSIFGFPIPTRLLAELAGAAILIAGAAYIHHRIYTSGIAAQQQADQQASAKVEAQAAAATQAAQDAANRAEESYRAEVTHNAALAASHPLGPVRLCLDTHARNISVPEASSTHPGNAVASTAPGSISGLPRGDSGLRPGAGPDLESLLDAWATRADKVSATLREFQSRH